MAIARCAMIVFIAFAGCFVPRPGHRERLADISPLERALQRNAFRSETLSPLRDAINASLPSLMPRGWQWSGINPTKGSFQDKEIRLYIVSMPRLQNDEQLCGAEHVKLDPFPCIRASTVANNCRALEPGVIACDWSLMWRLTLYAVVNTFDLALDENSDWKGWKVNAAMFQQIDDTPESDIPGIVVLEQSYDTLRSGKLAPLWDDFMEFLAGFAEFVMLHEVGHIVKGHAELLKAPGAIELHNAYTADPDELDRERVADAFFATTVKAPQPKTLSAAMAAPLLFVAFTRHALFESFKECGFPPMTFDLNNATLAQKRAVVTTYLGKTCSGDHPYYLQRFVTIVKSASYRNINYPVLPDFVEDSTVHSRGCARIFEFYSRHGNSSSKGHVPALHRPGGEQGGSAAVSHRL